jgi:CHAT domain-containing protein
MYARAYASGARARESFVALAPGGGEDGVLTVGEIMDQLPDRRAELVVLSACQTALGRLSRAEGTVGFQRAFLARGVRGLLVSQWSVDDSHTALLMREFYASWMGGLSKAEALRRAQMEVAAINPNPQGVGRLPDRGRQVTGRGAEDFNVLAGDRAETVQVMPP